MNSNITYSLTFKLFEDSITFKKTSPCLEISAIIDMNKSILVSLFGEKAYEEAIMREAERIYGLNLENDGY